MWRPSPFVAATAALVVVAGATWWWVHDDAGTPGVEIVDGPTYSVAATSSTSLPEKALADLGLVVESLDGRRVALADLAGTPLVVNVWASSCVPCKAEMPTLDAFAASSPGVQVVGVNPLDDRAGLDDFVEEVAVRYPQYRDPDGSVLDAFGIAALPATIFVAADGRVITVHLGQLDAPELAAMAESAFGQD